MKLLILIAIVSIFSCVNSKGEGSTDQLKSSDSIFRAEGFDTSINISVPLSLYYKGKPLMTIGEDIKLVDTSFSFRYDPNGEYQDHFFVITDYLSVDDYYSMDLPIGSISGALYFSADKTGKVFRIEGIWGLEGDSSSASQKELVQTFINRYFPRLNSDFTETKTFEISHTNFIETFKKYPSQSDSRTNSGNRSNWTFEYCVKFIKNSL